jgi:hypothetical protein
MTVTVADLRPIDLFDELDDRALGEWAAVAHERRAPAGEVVVESGHSSEGLVCLLDGILQVLNQIGDRVEPFAHQTAPTWLGAVPTLTEPPPTRAWLR